MTGAVAWLGEVATEFANGYAPLSDWHVSPSDNLLEEHLDWE